jgi:hypothetical protein
MEIAWITTLIHLQSSCIARLAAALESLLSQSYK